MLWGEEWVLGEQKHGILSQPGDHRNAERTAPARPVPHPQAAGVLVEEEGLTIVSLSVV